MMTIFAKFKEEAENAFIQNRVSKADKLNKLRSALKGHTKKLIPKSTINSIEGLE